MFFVQIFSRKILRGIPFFPLLVANNEDERLLFMIIFLTKVILNYSRFVNIRYGCALSRQLIKDWVSVENKNEKLMNRELELRTH